jgi:putative effector of murein hydrolase
MLEFLQDSAYWALLLTAAAYQLGLWLHKKTGSALLHPIVVASAVVMPVLLLAGIPNETYQAGMKSISWLLTPCTVCFGISLYTQLNKLKGHIGAIFAGIAAGTAVSLLLVWGLCVLFGLNDTLTVTLLPKSVTTAMAQPLAEKAGGLPALTTAAVVITGILGSVLGPALCRLFRLKNDIACGVAYGTASHVVGTTKANEQSELCGAVSSLSLVIAGLLTAVVFSFVS